MTELERFLLCAGRHAAGYQYGSPDRGDGFVDCSSYTWQVLNSWRPDAAYDDKARGDITLWQGRGPWAPIEAVERIGVGRRVDIPVAGEVHLVQGWRTLTADGRVPPPTRYANGHAFFVLVTPVPEPGPGCWLIQSTGGFGWWQESTWADIVAPYDAGVRLAVLG